VTSFCVDKPDSVVPPKAERDSHLPRPYVAIRLMRHSRTLTFWPCLARIALRYSQKVSVRARPCTQVRILPFHLPCCHGNSPMKGAVSFRSQRLCSHLAPHFLIVAHTHDKKFNFLSKKYCAHSTPRKYGGRALPATILPAVDSWSFELDSMKQRSRYHRAETIRQRIDGWGVSGLSSPHQFPRTFILNVVMAN